MTSAKKNRNRTPGITDVTNDAVYTAAYSSDLRKYTVTFTQDDGTLISRTEAPYGTVITIPAAPVRDGYQFLYWKGSKYYPGDSYTVTGDHTFAAQWERKTSPSGVPDTGDSSTSGLWSAFLLNSLMTVCAAGFSRLKRIREQ